MKHYAATVDYQFTDRKLTNLPIEIVPTYRLNIYIFTDRMYGLAEMTGNFDLETGGYDL